MEFTTNAGHASATRQPFATVKCGVGREPPSYIVRISGRFPPQRLDPRLTSNLDFWPTTVAIHSGSLLINDFSAETEALTELSVFPDEVLDVGCGNGRRSEAFVNRCQQRGHRVASTSLLD